MADSPAPQTDALAMDTYIVAGSHAALALLGVVTMVALSMGA